MKLNIQMFASLGYRGYEGEIKYVGNFKGLDENDGLEKDIYIVMTQEIGDIDIIDGSKLHVYINDSPKLNVDMSQYTTTYTYNFTNRGTNIKNPGVIFTGTESGTNPQNPYYKDVVFNDVKYVFTPIGIITPINIKYYYTMASRSWNWIFDILNLNGPDYIDFYKVKHEAGYIPTIKFGCSPTGTGGTSYEDTNLLVPYRKVSFLGTAGATTYQLPETNLEASYVVTAQKLKSDGTYDTIIEGSGLTVNNTTGVVTFSTAPGVSPVTGRDNVIITYSKKTYHSYYERDNFIVFEPGDIRFSYNLSRMPAPTNYEMEDGMIAGYVQMEVYYNGGAQVNTYYEYYGSGLKTFTVNRTTKVVSLYQALHDILLALDNTSRITNIIISYYYNMEDDAAFICGLNTKEVTSFNYEQDKRIFVTDGTNKDVYSASNNIKYFPSSNYTVIGDETGISGYARGNGYLFTTKIGTDSIYVRTGMLINNIITFPSISDSPNINILGKPIELEDGEVLIPTNRGIERISYYNNEIQNELRSYYINGEITSLTVNDWYYSSWIVNSNLLYILLPTKNKIIIADLLQKTYVKEGSSPTGSRYSTSLAYQYEWYVWTDIKVNKKCKLIKHDDLTPENIYICAIDNVYLFDNTKQYDTQPGVNIWVDPDYTYRPIQGYWETPFLDFNQINVAKSIRNLYLNTRSKTGDYFEIGYILPDGTTEILEQHYGTVTDVFPKLIQIKNKIKKFMSVKLYIKNYTHPTEYVSETQANEYKNTTFNRLLIEYQAAGKYRGE